MNYLTTLLTLPITVFAVFFAVSNMSDISVQFLPGLDPYDMPLWALGLGMMGVGFLSGALFVWLLYQRVRFQHWQAMRKNKRLENELDELSSEKQDLLAQKDPAV